MNTQLRFTSVEARENQIRMQELKDQAEQVRLAEAVETAPAPRRTLVRPIQVAGHQLARGLLVVADELALEVADIIHGHRPHLRHHRHQH